MLLRCICCTIHFFNKRMAMFGRHPILPLLEFGKSCSGSQK